ncbi:MAG TPA: hypothetical protein VGB55_08070 [Tepidisphaeraceae bacterium]|jgi:hypothetical protein
MGKAPKIYVQVPANYDAAGDPEEDALHWAMHVCLTHQGRDETEWSGHRRVKWRMEDDLVGIPGEAFAHGMAKNKIAKITDRLQTENVIIKDDWYSKSSHICKAYGLAPLYKNAPLKKVLIKKASWAKKIAESRRTRSKAFKHTARRNKALAHLESWLDRIIVDEVSAMAYLDTLVPHKLAKMIRKRKTTPKEVIISEWRRSQSHAIFALTNPHPDFKESDYGRVDTPPTRMLSELRPFIGFAEGQRPHERLINLDITNSQLVFLLAHLQSAQAPNQPSKGRKQTHTHRVSVFEDLRDFCADVLPGKVYEKLMSDVGETDRGEFKRLFFRDVLYGDSSNPHYGLKSPIRHAFQRRYPAVWTLIEEAKLPSPRKRRRWLRNGPRANGASSKPSRLPNWRETCSERRVVS